MLSALKGDNGKYSMMRVSTATVVGSIMSVFVVHNIVSMVGGSGFISMGPEEASLIAAVIAAKVGQSFSGNKKEKKPLEDVPQPGQ